MRLPTVFLPAVMFVALALPPSSHGQEVTGGFVGRAVTAEDTPVAAVTVSVRGPNLQGERQTVTDQRGEFRFAALPVGTYVVRLTALGFRPVTVENVRIQVGKVTGLPPTTMDRQAVRLEPLLVRADAVSIDPTSTAIAAELDATTLEELPTDRDYQSAVIILPHANESFYGDAANIGGATGLENMLYIDGVNVTTPYDATRGTRLPYNFIESIQVKAGGYEAQYGRALGGVVNAVTYTGGNDFEANVFGFFTNSALATEPRVGGLVELTTGSFATYDVGFRLSGPIARDRLWFSAAYNPLFERTQKEIPGHGFFDDRRTEHRFAGKLSWRATQSTDVQLSLFGDPTTHHQVDGSALTVLPTDQIVNPDPLLAVRKEGGVNLALRARHELGNWGFVEASIARSTRSHTRNGDTDRGRAEPTFFDYWDGFIEDGYRAKDGSNSSRRTAARLSGTAFLGRHTITGGVEYEGNFLDTRGVIEWIRRTGASEFDSDYEDPSGIVRNRIPTLYLQDSWRLTERVTLNAGVRWSTQYLIGDADSVAQVLEDEWQPRVGFIWQLGRLGTQKVFGSYGRFFQQEPLYFSMLFHGQFYQNFSSYSSDPRLGGAPDNVFELSWDQSDFPNQPDIQVDYLDEFTVGYERLLANDLKLTARGIHRILRSSFGWAWDFTTPPIGVVIGTPGKGDLSFLPSPQRTYTALELTAERAGNHRLRFLISYVLSRSHGNYTGLFASDMGLAFPGGNVSLQLEEQAVNSTGLLPNDRTHVLKALGSYRFPFGVTAGTFLTVQSGTPLNQFGATSLARHPVFLVPRGSDGRTPTLYDINLRFTYEMPWLGTTSGRVILDLLHIGSPRRVVWVDQTKFLTVDDQGNQANENAHFGAPFAHQPPMTLRLGLDIGFGGRWK